MASNMNIMQLLQMIQNNPNPPAFIMEMLKSQSGGNPLFANILAMAQNGNRAGIEQVARNIYKFKNDNGCVTYQKGICGDCGTLMFILETPGTLNGKVEKDILNFGRVEAHVTFNDNNEFGFEFSGMKAKLDAFSTYMVIMKWNRGTFTTELNIYKLTHCHF